jgi:ketosteroid isomerase-like protein
MTQEDGLIIEQAYGAMQRGDLVSARTCFAPDAVVWHNFDRLERTLDETMSDWSGMIAAFPERGLENVTRMRTETGLFVQRHLFVVRDLHGQRRAWPICLIVTLADGHIVRIEEYVDRAVCFELAAA